MNPMEKVNIHILIPARLGSKGLPFKNRKLFDYTASIIPKELATTVTVSTNDKEINPLAISYNFNTTIRPDEISDDESSIRDVVDHFVYTKGFGIKKNDIIILLYLTYPERTWEDVENALLFYCNALLNNENCDSMLCKQPVKSHPYLCMYEIDNIHGEQIVSHDMYRRQDYPKCFELSHYISIFKVESLDRLNSNMYNNSTVFFPIDNVIDVDTSTDLKKYLS